jgi:hypothetical protein
VSRKKAAAIAAVWSSRTPEERAAIGRKISRAKRGQPRSPEATAKSAATAKARWATATPEQRAAKIAAAQAKSQTPEAKARRVEARRQWNSANPGAPGSSGLTLRQKVALFFASQPDASDAKCAKEIGRGLHVVRKYRDAKSRKPWRRDLLRKLLAKSPHPEILRFFRGDLPKCPACGKRAAAVFLDEARYHGRSLLVRAQLRNAAGDTGTTTATAHRFG